jgi:2-C-methyl-D-erythritol 4-phosphate cytidylyltransferase/2-C-methyl-D-erythritol 2,4-cyclodiphosphate synthase
LPHCLSFGILEFYLIEVKNITLWGIKAIKLYNTQNIATKGYTLKETTLILLCAGESSRFQLNSKKQWLRTDDTPLWLDLANRLSSYKEFKDTIIVCHKDEINYMKNFTDDFQFIVGGENRQNSIENGLNIVDTKYVLISDVARACVPKSVIDNIMVEKENADCVVPYLNVVDTVVYGTNTINRDDIKLLQTPQLSKTAILKKAIINKNNFTDESSAILAFGGTICYVKGSDCSKKLTFKNELNTISCLKAPSKDSFVGTGFDIHPFEPNKPMVLGGVILPYDYGFKAHSDGDVVIHSVIDALLGAIGAGDIGEFFPDNDTQYKNANSANLLKYIVNFVRNVSYEIINIDITILAQIPKINPHKQDIKTSLSKLLNIPKSKINIKATTTEQLGFIGRQEAIAVQSIANLKYYDWTQ